MISTGNFLVNHAYQHVWCGPGQDRQYIVSPTLITGMLGATYRVDVGISVYTLPTARDVYDVMVFGDLPPSALGMDDRREVWISAKAQCEANKLLIHLYNKDGIHYPLAKAWFLYTRSGNLVIALERIAQLPNFGRETLFVRWRSAAYFETVGATNNIGVRVGYVRFESNNSAYQTFRQQLIDIRALGYGATMCFRNGRRLRDFHHSTLRVGDQLEWIFDGDVKEIFEIPYRQLEGFLSEKDGELKFLIPRSRQDQKVDFIDETDFYILNYTKVAEYDGVYYTQNRVDSVRMVTHKDYDLSAQYVNSVMSTNRWSDDDDVRVEVTVRHGGMDRDLVFEHHRIKELIKIPDPQRIQAMVGPNSGVEVWQASNLEDSPYIKLMMAPYGSITPEDVIRAYGYNAVSRLTGFVPILVEPGQSIVKLFYGQYTQSTVYEYDANRVLIGWYPHEQAQNYPIRNADCRYVEAYAGTGGEGLSTVYNDQLSPIPYVISPNMNYRFYKGVENIGGEFEQWEDITGDTTIYNIVNNVVVWEPLPPNTVTAIRNDRNFLSKDLYLPSDEGILVFTVGSEEVYPGTSNGYQIMDIPPGEWDIFLNGNDLAQGIDYYVNWPEIAIVSKRHWKNQTSQKITLRCRGFCDKDLQPTVDEEVGMVTHGQLSRNGRYNVRDDKVTRITMGGKLYLVSEVGFAEDGEITPNVPNGIPYRIVHPYIPLTPFVPCDTYAYRQKSRIVDEEIEGYLNGIFPEPPITTPNPIPQTYKLISTFSSKVIQDILRGIITMDAFMGDYSLQDVYDRLDGYQYLLPFDPVFKDMDPVIFEIVPHTHTLIEVDFYQFRFISRMIEVYLNNAIPLERYAIIKQE